MPQDEPFDSRDANASGRMARELARRNRFARQTVASRWASWARALAGRHTLFASWPRASKMVYIQAGGPVEFHTHSTRLSLGVYPRINLAIQPILRELISRPAKRLRGNGGMAAAGPSPGPLVLLRQMNARERLRDLNGPGAASSLERRDTTSIFSSEVDRTISPRGLSLVFRRLARPDELARASGGADAVHRSAEQIALRVIEQSRRIEQRAPAVSAVVARQARQASPQSPQAAITTAGAADTAPAVKGTQFGQWPGQPSELPDAVVEQLTERVIRQIDRRVIAHRERMGMF